MYNYENEKPKLFTPEGFVMLRAIEKNVERHLKSAGAFMASKAWEGITGDSWLMLAALDYLVEIHELLDVSPAQSTWAQNRVYIGVE
jgi:hypothetical protein